MASVVVLACPVNIPMSSSRTTITMTVVVSVSVVLVLCGIIAVISVWLPAKSPTAPLDDLMDVDVDLEDLKARLMKGLGLTKLPDASKMNVSQEEYARMYQIYLSSIEESRRERQKREKVDPEVTAQRFYSFTNTGHAVREHTVRRWKRGRARTRRLTAATWLYFPIDIPEMYTNHHVEVDHANLRLFVSARDMTKSAGLEVRVYMSQDHDTKGETNSRVLIDTRIVQLEPHASKWTEFDVTVAAQTWISSNDKSNFGLELECRECSKEGVTLITGSSEGGNTSLNAVINILTNVRPRSRSKRSTDGDPLTYGHRSRRLQCRKDGQRCCRHRMDVLFTELEGFEFILQPKSFDAGYCKGRCPPRYNPAHHHAVLQSLIWKKNRGRAPKPCCAPSKLRELEILHLDEENNTKLKVTKWKDIQVTECACS